MFLLDFQLHLIQSLSQTHILIIFKLHYLILINIKIKTHGSQVDEGFFIIISVVYKRVYYYEILDDWFLTMPILEIPCTEEF